MTAILLSPAAQVEVSLWMRQARKRCHSELPIYATPIMMGLLEAHEAITREFLGRDLVKAEPGELRFMRQPIHVTKWSRLMMFRSKVRRAFAILNWALGSAYWELRSGVREIWWLIRL